MATYQELHELTTDVTLLQRVTMAVVIACNTIRSEPADTEHHAARLTWALNALTNPDGMARQLLWILLAQYKDLTVTQIIDSTDEDLQSAVLGAVDLYR